MRELPILFNTEMVLAILDGRKTATRRVVKDPYFIENEEASRGGGFAMHKGTDISHGMPYPATPYMVGDILYVRETWAQAENGCYLYKADSKSGVFARENGGKLHCTRWRPSIHMPKEEARIWLKVTDVRIERLRDITEEGAVKEGLYKGWRLHGMGSLANTARQAFMWLWETITRKAPAAESWACNPWVWVIEFKRCEKPGR